VGGRRQHGVREHLPRLAALARRAPSPDAVGAMLAFGTGVACEAAFLRWRSAPDVVAAGAE
jgi:hypothetical protein